MSSTVILSEVVAREADGDAVEGSLPSVMATRGISPLT
jgi:hypothetical protein